MRNLFKTFVLILSFCMIPVGTAKAARINQKTATVRNGSLVLLEVVGTNKKVKWSSSNKKIATVSKYGIVTAKNVGKCTITAKVGKKKYKCKVTVVGRDTAGSSNNDNKTEIETKPEDSFNAEEAKQNVQLTTYPVEDSSGDIIVFVKNNYNTNLTINFNGLYYDSFGTMIATKDLGYVYCLAPNSESVFAARSPYDSNYDRIQYDSYEISMSVEKSNSIEHHNDVSIISNYGTDSVVVTIGNICNKEIDSCEIIILFYKEGKIIGYNSSYSDIKSPASIDYETFKFPHDENYDTVVPDDYKIYINEAYSYNW